MSKEDYSIEEDLEETMRCLKEANKEIDRLNEELKQAKEIALNDHKYASEMEDKYITANNIINELEKWLEQEYAFVKANSIQEPNNPEWYIKRNERKNILDKLQELKGSDEE